MVSISVALTVNKRVEIGIVYIPVMDQMFSARRDRGAFLNGKPIKVNFPVLSCVKAEHHP